MMEQERIADDARAGTTAAPARHATKAVPVRIECTGLTHAGRVRSHNEDHFVIASMRKSVDVMDTNVEDRDVFSVLQTPSAHLLVVADGVGGRSGGRIASGMAVQTIVQYLSEAVGCYQRMDVNAEHEFLEHLTMAVQQSHDRIQSEFGGGGGPATTVTMVTLVWPRAYFVHVGDSRAYFLRDGRLRQITQDQTMGDLMVDIGVMKEDEARKGGLFDVLASAVGGELSPSVGLVDLQPGDDLLLCTDGLTRHLDDARIASTLAAAPDGASACRSLIDGALQEGGLDNVTVVVARCTPG
jgi:PPM family protein phosphatase